MTLRWLKTRRACDKAVDAFITKYDRDGKPTVQNVVKACWRDEAASWSFWLLVEILPPNLSNRWWTANWNNGRRRVDIRIAREYQRLADAQGRKKRKGKK